MAGAWDQNMFNQALAEKYRQSGTQVAAQAAEARARAGLYGEQAKTIVPLAQSSIATDASNRALTDTQTEWLPRLNQADIDYKNANKNFINTQNYWYGTKTLSDMNEAGARSRNYDATSLGMLNDIRPAASPFEPIGSASKRLLGGIGGFRILPGFKRGVTSVPGKGAGDKMPAMLEPKEAVLNKHAADMLGRKKIAQLNKAGNEKRTQQATQKMSKLAQALKQAGMI